MSAFIASYVYITRNVFLDIYQRNDYDHMHCFFNKLKDILRVYERSSNIVIESAADLLDYTDDINPISLGDLLIDSVGNDYSLLNYYYDLLEKTISSVKSNKYSEHINHVVINSALNTFPRHYYLFLTENFAPELSRNLQTDCWSDTLSKNSEFIALQHNGKKQFIEWSKLNYNNIDFHSDLESTLDTILAGTYLDYKNLITNSLNSLNQASYEFSTDPQGNQDELIRISEYTSRFGKQLSCTRQGANKPKFAFPKTQDGSSEMINCEYHLKVNWNDRGDRLERDNYVRIYFGLKYYDDIGIKKVKLAHIGRHLP